MNLSTSLNNPKPLVGTITPSYQKIEMSSEETSESSMSEIEQEINMLSACLEALERATTRLETKTQYIVLPVRPPNNGDTAKTQSRNSQLGTALQQLSSSFGGRIERLEDIVRRIQL